MKIFVMSRANAKRASYSWSIPVLIISITDTDKHLNSFSKNNPNIKAVCKVQFDDVDYETKLPHEMLMSEADAFKIKQYVDTYKDEVESIIVHCEAGISRSSGIAAAIGKVLNGSDDFIFDNRRFCPNMHCYSLMLRTLMLDED